MTKRLSTLVILATLLASADVRSEPPVAEWPQAKVDRVDASNPGKWRVYVTGMDEGGKAIQLKEKEVALFLAETKDQVRNARDPIEKFKQGAAAPGFSGRFEPVAKADVKQAAILVAAVHTDISPDVWAILPKVLAEPLAGLRKDARVGVVFYDDSIRVMTSPDGTRIETRSINSYQHCLGDLRAKSSSSVDETAAIVPCARLFATPDAVKDRLDKGVPARQGWFPRLFGIPESAEVMAVATSKGQTRIDAAELSSGNERFANGGLEAALRMLLANTSPDTLREVVLVSDGRDGYMRVAEAVAARAKPPCRDAAKTCTNMRRKAQGEEVDPNLLLDVDNEGGSKDCSREILECAVPKISDALRQRETVVKDYLAEIIPLFRAADVRISVIAVPGTDVIGLARLQAIAVKTGGTFRKAANAGELALAAKQVGDELAAQVSISPDAGLDPEKPYAVQVRLDGSELKTTAYPFKTGERVLPTSGLIDRGRGLAIRQLGPTWGPVAFWCLFVLVLLGLLLFVFTMGKAVVGKIKKPKAPKLPKAPKGPAIPKPPAIKVPQLKK